MKILITHAYTKNNKGDAAILSVLLSQLSGAFPDSSIKISTYDNVAKNKTFEGFSNISSFLYLIAFSYKNKFVRAFYAAYIFAATILWAIIYRIFRIRISFLLSQPVRIITEELSKSDLVVPIGGGYIRSKLSIGDTIDLILVLHPILLAEILGKPVILHSQSIGPFYNSFQRTITRIILNRVNLIMVREDNTVRTLKDLGINNNLIVRTVDAAFLFQTNTKIRLSDIVSKTKLKNKTLVGITVRKWLKKEGQEKYESEFAKFINHEEKNDKNIFIFIPQVTSSLHHDDDRTVADRIIKKVHDKRQVINLTDNYSHHEIKTIYEHLDYIIGTRFHSVIFSLISGVPALAIEYEYKTSGIMKDLGLSAWVISMEEVTEKELVKHFESLVKNSLKYKKILNKNLPDYIQKAKKSVEYFKKTYENS